MKFYRDDFFRRTLFLALCGRGHVSPNPEVGCVIVKDKKIIGEGWHPYYGGPHAEVQAIQNAENQGYCVAGACVFVSLEPCAHTGKTPPCVEMLIQKKVSEVCIFFLDPNPLVSGKGVQILKNAGILVSFASSNLQNEYSFFYEPFQKYITTHIPFITGKIAKTKNGEMGIIGENMRISGDETQKFTYGLRQKHDAILVGAHTILVDNPHLGVREIPKYYEEYEENTLPFLPQKVPRDPLRLIMDPHGICPHNAQVFRDENFLLITEKTQKVSAEKYFGKSHILEIPVQKNNSFSLPVLLQILGEKKIASILVEGGEKTIQSFFQANVFDEFIEYESPNIIIHKNVIPAPIHSGKLWKTFFIGMDAIKIWKDF